MDFKKTLRIGWAIILIIAGLIGIILPLAPGIPFLLLGLYFLNPIWYRKNMKRIKEKFFKKNQNKDPN